MVDLNTLIAPHSSLTLVDAYNISDRGEVAGTGVPAGCQPSDSDICGHLYLLIPDGDCDSDCDGRIAASQSNLVPAQQPATMKPGNEVPMSPAERLRSQMRQRYHLPGQPPTPRD